MLYFLVIVALVSYCNAGGDYAPSRPHYRAPERKVPLQYDAPLYSVASPSDYQSAPVQYSSMPKEYLQARLPMQYESSSYHQSDNPDYYGEPEQVVIPQSAGVHDGGAEIPGMGFVKGYPFSYLVNEPAGYDIPGLGFIAGYPFSYIGPYVPKSDPKTDAYSDSYDYRYPAPMENPEDAYSPKGDNSYLSKAQSLLPTQTASAYSPKDDETPYSSEGVSQIKPVKVQFIPPFQDSYAYSDSYKEVSPSQQSYSPQTYSPQSYFQRMSFPHNSLTPSSYSPSTTSYQSYDPYAAFNPAVSSDPYASKQDTTGYYPDKTEPTKYSPIRYRPGAPIRSYSHIPKTVQLPKFLTNRPSQLRTQSYPTYQYK